MSRRGSSTNGQPSWRQALGVRIVAILFVTTGVAAIFESTIEWRATERSMREELVARGGSQVRGAVRWLREQVVPPVLDFTEIEDYVEDVVKREHGAVFAAVVRNNGTPIATWPKGVDFSRADDEVLRFSEPITVPGTEGVLAWFHLGLSLEPMQAQLRDRVERLLLRACASAALVGLAIWLVLRRVVVQPLKALDLEAVRLGRGELEQPLADHGRTEIGRLGRTLDDMRKNLAASHAAVADQNKRLRELDRLKSEFLANMSHEMRTPLTSILGEAEILADATALQEEASVSARAVHRNGERLLELVDRLLDLAKLESGKLLVAKRPCRPAEVVEQSCARFADEVHRKDLRLRVDVAALGATVVRTDPARVAQMLANVVGNAVKFTAAGEITVTGSFVATERGQELAIVVQDTGIGIPAEFLHGGIVAFRQADGSLTRQHGGSGLGLYITQQIARSLDGDLDVTSEVGKGTRVCVRVAVEPVEATKSVQAGTKGRVLVVDDARDNQHLLKTMLQKLGHTVELADNGRLGVDKVKAMAPSQPFDLILMDLQMPELDGIGAIRELRTAGYSMPIVALTAHALADDRERCLAAGATAYETKPITRQRLGEVVAVHLATAAAGAR